MTAAAETTGSTAGTPWPVELKLTRDTGVLTVAFDTGETFSLAAEYLRVLSPSAEVTGHGGPRKTVPGKRDVRIDRLEPVGTYAVRIVFDDGHDTGLFSWAYLHELGRTHEEKWATYLTALDREGLSRTP